MNDDYDPERLELELRVIHDDLTRAVNRLEDSWERYYQQPEADQLRPSTDVVAAVTFACQKAAEVLERLRDHGLRGDR